MHTADGALERGAGDGAAQQLAPQALGGGLRAPVEQQQVRAFRESRQDRLVVELIAPQQEHLGIRGEPIQVPGPLDPLQLGELALQALPRGQAPEAELGRLN